MLFNSWESGKPKQSQGPLCLSTEKRRKKGRERGDQGMEGRKFAIWVQLEYFIWSWGSANKLSNILTPARRRQWHSTPVLLPGKSHGRGSLVGCSLWGCEELDTTERLHFHVPLSCIGEGNGNPLQCSCLENPSDGGAWWVAIYGVAQSRTRLKRQQQQQQCWASQILFCKALVNSGRSYN